MVTEVSSVSERAAAPLVGLLGDARRAIVEFLRNGPRTAAELAEHLGTSRVAVRKHLGVLEQRGYVEAETVNRGRGRPAAHYRLTDAARALFPNRAGDLASELIEFISDRDGRDGVRAFMRWRHERETDALGAVVTAEDLHERLGQLVEVLNERGFAASLTEAGGEFQLTQTHCSVYDVAKEHPEVCAYEAATFQKVLGAKVSRRETLAKGDAACVCTVRALQMTE